MKKVLLILTLGGTLFFSCREKQNIIPEQIVDPIDTTNKVDSSYVIYGVTDYMIKSIERKVIPLEIVLKSTTQEKVTLSVDGLPENATATFAPSTGYPGFTTDLTIETVFTQTGTYPIIIKGTSEKQLTKSYNINLTIEAVPCDSILVYRTNNFRTRSVLNQYILYGNTHMDVDLDNPNRYYFSSLLVGMDADNQILTYQDVDYVVDCDSLNVSIPTVTVLGSNKKTGETRSYTVEGSGQINTAERKIIINYRSKDEQGNRYSYEMYADIILQ